MTDAPKMTTLCYIERGNRYLMLHRVKKQNDENHDKWIGVGGHFEKGESPEECLLRETREETGLTLTDYALRGVITFVNGDQAAEYMFLFTATGFEGDMTECDEGALEWIDKDALYALPMWAGDRIFLKLIASPHPFFSLKLRYENEALVEAALDGKPLEI